MRLFDRTKLSLREKYLYSVYDIYMGTNIYIYMSALYHNCEFDCQQRVLKTFPGPGYLHSEDGVVWLCHLLVNLYIRIYIYYIYTHIFIDMQVSGYQVFNFILLRYNGRVNWFFCFFMIFLDWHVICGFQTVDLLERFFCCIKFIFL